MEPLLVTVLLVGVFLAGYVTAMIRVKFGRARRAWNRKG